MAGDGVSPWLSSVWHRFQSSKGTAGPSGGYSHHGIPAKDAHLHRDAAVLRYQKQTRSGQGFQLEQTIIRRAEERAFQDRVEATMNPDALRQAGELYFFHFVEGGGPCVSSSSWLGLGLVRACVVVVCTLRPVVNWCGIRTPLRSPIDCVSPSACDTAKRLRSPEKGHSVAAHPSKGTTLRGVSVEENRDILLPSLTSCHHPLETFFDLLDSGKISEEGLCLTGQHRFLPQRGQ